MEEQEKKCCGRDLAYIAKRSAERIDLTELGEPETILDLKSSNSTNSKERQ